jgi:hypothetical protein
VTNRIRLQAAPDKANASPDKTASNPEVLSERMKSTAVTYSGVSLVMVAAVFLSTINGSDASDPH